MDDERSLEEHATTADHDRVALGSTQHATERGVEPPNARALAVLPRDRARGLRGCHHALLDAFDLQSRELDERLGSAVFAELPDFPRGHVRFFLTKALAASAGDGSPAPSRTGRRATSAP